MQIRYPRMSSIDRVHHTNLKAPSDPRAWNMITHHHYSRFLPLLFMIKLFSVWNYENKHSCDCRETAQSPACISTLTKTNHGMNEDGGQELVAWTKKDVWNGTRLRRTRRVVLTIVLVLYPLLLKMVAPKEALLLLPRAIWVVILNLIIRVTWHTPNHQWQR